MTQILTMVCELDRAAVAGAATFLSREAVALDDAEISSLHLEKQWERPASYWTRKAHEALTPGDVTLGERIHVAEIACGKARVLLPDGGILWDDLERLSVGCPAPKGERLSIRCRAILPIDFVPRVVVYASVRPTLEGEMVKRLVREGYVAKRAAAR